MIVAEGAGGHAHQRGILTQVNGNAGGQQLITLRKTLPLLTWGDYQDLLPDHPSLWCYRRQWQGQTLVVAANLSRDLQTWQPEEAPGDWKMIISNYAETTPRPTGLTLRPFEAVWWLQA